MNPANTISMSTVTNTSDFQASTFASVKQDNWITVTLEGKNLQRLVDLMKVTDAFSTQEVIKNALRLYSATLDLEKQGSKLMIQDESGNLVRYRVL